MKNKKNVKSKEEFELRKDCIFYQKNGSYVLTDFVCKNKDCSFYKKNQRYIEN